MLNENNTLFGYGETSSSNDFSRGFIAKISFNLIILVTLLLNCSVGLRVLTFT